MGKMDKAVNEADLNMQHVDLQEFCDYIRDRIEMEEFTQPILGIGKSGIGKTESIENAICKPLGIGLIEMRLGSYSETDLTGFPIPEKDETTGQTMMRFADVAKFPHVGRDKECGILLLDEFTNARPAVRAAALQLTDKSRSIGDYKLPDKWLIVILGNGPTDGGYFQGLEYALMGRADCFRIDVNYEVWKAWALRTGVHPAVLGFINDYEDGPANILHRIKDMDEVEYEQKDANPRCWVKLSDHLKKKEARIGGLLDERQVMIYAGAAVGADIAPRFAAYYAYQKEMIKSEDILNGSILNSDIRGYRTESLYMSILSVANATIQMLRDNKDMIIAEDTIKDSDKDKFRNLLKFIVKLADSGKLDPASTIIESIQLGEPALLSALLLSDRFDDDFPEMDEVYAKLGDLINFKYNLNAQMGK